MEPTQTFLCLGGSSKKHDYLHKYFDEVLFRSLIQQMVQTVHNRIASSIHFCQYSTSPIQMNNIRTAQCHKHGVQTYTNWFMNRNLKITAVCPL